MSQLTLHNVPHSFRIGDIVRRANGYTPMRIRALLGASSIVVQYCGSRADDVVYLKHGDIVKVTDPVVEFKGCPDWVARLSFDDRMRLGSQLSKNAKSPWPSENAWDQTPEGNTMPKLYQTKEETPRFGTLLATNSAGKYVIEMKGTGEVLTFDKGDVEEVKPYTVTVRFVTDTSGKTYDFLSRKGDVSVDDLVLVKGYTDMARVTAVNTKSERATVELVGRKVATIPFGEDPVTE